jgi:hypothetical protein
MITAEQFPCTTRPPLGALPYCRFFQAVKAYGSTEPDSVDSAHPGEHRTLRGHPAPRLPGPPGGVAGRRIR